MKRTNTKPVKGDEKCGYYAKIDGQPMCRYYPNTKKTDNGKYGNQCSPDGINGVGAWPVGRLLMIQRLKIFMNE